MTNCVLKITLSNEMMKEIGKYKKSVHKQSMEETVVELINYALKLPHYFLNFDWKKAELEADREISSGKTESFDTVEEFLADLKK